MHSAPMFTCKATPKGLEALSKIPNLEELCLMHTGRDITKVCSNFSKLKKLSFWETYCNTLWLCKLLKAFGGVEELSFQTHVGSTEDTAEDITDDFQNIVELLKSRPTTITLNITIYRTAVNSTDSKVKFYKKGVRLTSYKSDADAEIKVKFEVTFMDELEDFVKDVLETQITQSTISKTLDENNFEEILAEELENFTTYKPKDEEFPDNTDDESDSDVCG